MTAATGQPNRPAIPENGDLLVLPGQPSEVTKARRWLAGLLGDHPAADEALLALSELATNAVLHSGSGLPGGTFKVRAGIDPERVLIEVTDLGGPWSADAPETPPGPDASNSPPESDRLRGRGLAIVAKLAADWGITGGAASRTAWCVIGGTSPQR